MRQLGKDIAWIPEAPEKVVFDLILRTSHYWKAIADGALGWVVTECLLMGRQWPCAQKYPLGAWGVKDPKPMTHWRRAVLGLALEVWGFQLLNKQTVWIACRLTISRLWFLESFSMNRWIKGKPVHVFGAKCQCKTKVDVVLTVKLGVGRKSERQGRWASVWEPKYLFCVVGQVVKGRLPSLPVGISLETGWKIRQKVAWGARVWVNLWEQEQTVRIFRSHSDVHQEISLQNCL